MAKRIVVVGAGLGGLTAAALLAKAGHSVTVLERNSWIGGKSRRIEVAGQRIDTGPSLVTFPAVLEEFFNRYDSRGTKGAAAKLAALELERLPEVGRYYFGSEIVDLPVPADHPWHEAWVRFESEHGHLGPEITNLLTSDPFDAATLPAVTAITKAYGRHLSTRAYLNSLDWMPDGLREVIAIHTLNAGISPERTLALYATIAGVMAKEGIFVPRGGVYEIALALGRLASTAGAEIITGVEVEKISKGSVRTSDKTYEADYIIAATDAQVTDRLLGKKRRKPRRVSCSGVAIFAVLKEPLPEGTVTHSVIMPSDPRALHKALDQTVVPSETMAFLNYYEPGHIYPNDKATAAILLTAPANGEHFDLNDEFVQAQLERISDQIGLEQNIQDLILDYKILDPGYFAEFGANGGSLYGTTRPIWQGGPLHLPGYNSLWRPWLWRVGASVHPGGGIPAVLGGAMISSARLINRIGAKN
ncbi:phytoene desaturase family protein [Rhodoluna limnophila]|uniref:phytoene desaturase family protein n=1 Tax=Rhodoluna limnophila TaxID=232537 RepID=UPI00110579EF|nr:FAD-dependent oxidoreductase [Rhodoluna limnophila]